MNDSSVRTSETSPIRVDFVPGQAFGLTFAPGKKGSSSLGAYRWDRDLDADLARLAETHGIDVVVTLLEGHEFDLLQIPTLRDAVRKHGMVSHWVPIADQGVPPDVAEFRSHIETIRAHVDGGDRVALHCRGGLGRAGTVAACLMVTLGETAPAAIALVRQGRAGAVENRAQEEFVDRFEAFWRGTS